MLQLRVNKFCIKRKLIFFHKATQNYIIEQIITTETKKNQLSGSETSSIRYLKFKKLLIYKLMEVRGQEESKQNR